jgi:hypothetical protein
MTGLKSQRFPAVAAARGIALAGAIGAGSYSALYGAVLDAQSEPEWSRESLRAEEVYALALCPDAVYVSTNRGLYVARRDTSGARKGQPRHYDPDFQTTFGTIAGGDLKSPFAAAGSLLQIVSNDYSRGSFRRSDRGQWDPIEDGMEVLADGKPPKVTALAAVGSTIVAGTETGRVYQFCLSSGGVHGADAWRKLPFKKEHGQRITALAIGPSAIYASNLYDVYSAPIPVCGQPVGAFDPMTGDLMRFPVLSLAVYGDYLFAGTNAGSKCGLHRTLIAPQTAKAGAKP